VGPRWRPGEAVLDPDGPVFPAGADPCAFPAQFGTVTGVSIDADLVDLADPEAIGDDALVRALIVLTAEQRRRAVATGDTAALVEQGFRDGFTRDGMPANPWMVSGIIVCAGAKVERSAMSHRCAFARVGPAWVWEADQTIEDVVRYVPGRTQQMRSVSLVPAVEGLAVDLVEARTRQGVHELVGVRSFIVERSELVLVSARSVGRITHR
jgi:hypothetical protein